MLCPVIGDILQPTHLLFVLVIALLVLGPKRLPEVGKSLGRGLRDFRSALSGDDHDDERPLPQATQQQPEATYQPPAFDEPAPAPPAPEAQPVHEPQSAVSEPAAPVHEEPAPTGSSPAEPAEHVH